MKTLEEFRAKRKVLEGQKMIDHLDEFLNYETYDDMEVKPIKIHTYNHTSILEFDTSISTDPFYLNIERSDCFSSDLASLEALLWDWYKWELGVSYENMEEDLHQRARAFMEENGFPAVSLDELDIDIEKDLALWQQQHYLLNKFEEIPQIEVPQSVALAPQFIQDIDWDTFKEQRQLIMDIQSSTLHDVKGRKVFLENEDNDKLECIIKLFDGLMDYAIDEMKMPVDKVIIKS